ncbi:MAG: Ig-like domain-containing protein [Flavobacteriaceae bacterium]
MRKTLGFIAAILWVISASHCAKRGTPTGGSKDSIPPILLNANPPLETVNFNQERVVLVFDEYIQLKDIDNQLIVSPPIDKKNYKILPEGTVSKKVEIRFETPPRKNTTYTFNFGAAIEDFNEKNPLPFFNYTFSTGSYLDSLSLSGRVKDAFENEPLKQISIYLYPIDSTYTDSTIFLQKPLYVGNTLDSIAFKLKNLAPGQYEFLAIEDVGKNYLFDQNSDKIGFLKEPIRLPQDSVVFPVLFKEMTTFSWGRPRFVNDHHLEFSYYGEIGDRRPIFDSVFKANAQGFFTQDRIKDTIHYWFQPQENLDSLQVSFQEKDSLRQLTLKPFIIDPDSLTFSFTPPNKSPLHFMDTLKIKSSLPVERINTDYISVFDIDTLEVDFSAEIDHNKDIVYLNFEKVPNDNYKIQLLPNAITDFLGATNDTLTHQVKTKKIEDYGTLYLRIDRKDPTIPYFFELIDKQGKVVRKITQNKDDYYTLGYLLPNNYQIRYVKDLNNNQKWDTGNYLDKRQPEEVIYLSEALSLRANWDLNETLIIE